MVPTLFDEFVLSPNAGIAILLYLDNHSTTPLDPLALEAMLPLFREQFANAGSITHQAGRDVAELVEKSIAGLAQALGAESDELVITSGATESNNLALFGALLHPRQKRRRVVSVVTEHKAILDPLGRLERNGFEVHLASVMSNHSDAPGQVDFDQLKSLIDEDTALVSVMLANNEIGTIQPLVEIAALCREVGCLLHTDASQAVGRMPVNVDALDVDLLSFSGHKFYGPKGIGGLYVRRRGRRVKLQAQIVGGGQQMNFRSGTLNVPGIVGMATALKSTLDALTEDVARIAGLRNRLYERLVQEIEDVTLNGPQLQSALSVNTDSPDRTQSGGFEINHRLSGNLNCCFYPVEGQSLMMSVPELAVSSGSACTSAEPSPSHVLQAIGLSEEQARSSLRFGVGRFNTVEEIDQAAERLGAAGRELRKLV